MTPDQLRKLIERERQLHDQFPLSYEHIQTHKKLEEALRALAPHFLALWEAVIPTGAGSIEDLKAVLKDLEQV